MSLLHTPNSDTVYLQENRDINLVIFSKNPAYTGPKKKKDKASVKLIDAEFPNTKTSLLINNSPIFNELICTCNDISRYATVKIKVLQEHYAKELDRLSQLQQLKKWKDKLQELENFLILQGMNSDIKNDTFQKNPGNVLLRKEILDLEKSTEILGIQVEILMSRIELLETKIGMRKGEIDQDITKLENFLQPLQDWNDLYNIFNTMKQQLERKLLPNRGIELNKIIEKIKSRGRIDEKKISKHLTEKTRISLPLNNEDKNFLREKFGEWNKIINLLYNNSEEKSHDNASLIVVTL